VRDVFHERPEARLRRRVSKVHNAIGDAHAGQRNEHAFENRRHGSGPRWKLAYDAFALHGKRLELAGDEWRSLRESPTEVTEQRSLF